MHYGDVFNDIELAKARDAAKAKKHEQMRFELIKAALTGLNANPKSWDTTDCILADLAVTQADAVLARLDKEAT